MKREILAIGAALLFFGGCAQKDLTSNVATQTAGEMLLQTRSEHPLNKKLLKRAVKEVAKEKGWIATGMGEREVILEKYFSETKNIAVELFMRSNGYDLEYSSGQNISDREAKNLLEELKEAIDDKMESLGAMEH